MPGNRDKSNVLGSEWTFEKSIVLYFEWETMNIYLWSNSQSKRMQAKNAEAHKFTLVQHLAHFDNDNTVLYVRAVSFLSQFKLYSIVLSE